MSPSPCPDPGQRGTSLIELLSSLAAAAVLVLALLDGVSAATEAWHRQIGGLGSSQFLNWTGRLNASIPF